MDLFIYEVTGEAFLCTPHTAQCMDHVVSNTSNERESDDSLKKADCVSITV